MRTFPGVSHTPGAVDALRWDGRLWHAQLKDTSMQARAVLLATGVIDIHPELPGYMERWGHAIHHCPYCHGWEMQQRPLAVMAAGEAAGHMGLLLRGWSDDVIVLTHGQELPSEVREKLAAAKVPVIDEPLARLEGPGRQLHHVVFADNTRLARRGLFVAPTQKQAGLVERLGAGDGRPRQRRGRPLWRHLPAHDVGCRRPHHAHAASWRGLRPRRPRRGRDQRRADADLRKFSCTLRPSPLSCAVTRAWPWDIGAQKPPTAVGP